MKQKTIEVRIWDDGKILVKTCRFILKPQERVIDVDLYQFNEFGSGLKIMVDASIADRLRKRKNTVRGKRTPAAIRGAKE